MINSTRIRVGRNFAAYPLGTCISEEDRLKIMEAVKTATSHFEGELAGEFHELANIPPDRKKALVEGHHLFKDDDAYLAACGL